MSPEEHKLCNPAQNLIIKMTQRGRQLVNLVLPAQAIKWVTNFIPDALIEALQKAGVDLKALELRYRTKALYPGSVLALALPEQEREVLFYLT